MVIFDITSTLLHLHILVSYEEGISQQLLQFNFVQTFMFPEEKP